MTITNTNCQIKPTIVQVFSFNWKFNNFRQSIFFFFTNIKCNTLLSCRNSFIWDARGLREAEILHMAIKTHTQKERKELKIQVKINSWQFWEIKTHVGFFTLVRGMPDPHKR